MLNNSLTHPFVFKRPSSSTGHNFTDAVLNIGGSDEGEGGGTGYDATR
jgi:hypothetical protein